MNLTKYDIFFKVLETKTISQAAKDLGYSQSAVSQTIKSLEEELETTLFIRQKSGVILSKDGHAYLPYLKSVQASLDNLRTKKQEMKGLDQVTLRIGTFTSVSRHLLPSLMEEFIEMYPNIQFELYQNALSDYDDLCLIPIQENLFRHVGIAYNNYDTLSYAGKTFLDFILRKTPEILKNKDSFHII